MAQQILPNISLLFACSLPFLQPKTCLAKIPIPVQTGYAATEMGEIDPAALKEMPQISGFKAGYVYKRFGVLWINVWTWGGEYALYREDGNEIVIEELTKEQFAALLGRDPDEISPPWAYKYPLLWRIVGFLVACVGGLAIFGTIVARNNDKKLIELKDDPHYSQAFKMLAKRCKSSYEERGKLSTKRRDRAIAEAADYLESEGVNRMQAERYLKWYCHQNYPDPPAE